MKLPNLVLIILSIFDIATTYIVFENGGKELNPIMAPLGIWEIMIVRIIFVGGAIYIISKIETHSSNYESIRYAPLVAYCGISTIWLAAVMNNLWVILG